VKSNESENGVDGLDDDRGITRTVSDSSDSNMSDAEVNMDITKDNPIHHSQVEKSNKMYSRAMSSSYCQVNNINNQEIIQIFTFQANKATLSKTSHKKLVDIRSLSTPDLNQFDSEVSRFMIYIEINALYIQVTSPYVSLEMLDEPDYKGIAQHRSPNHRIYSSDSSSDSSSGIQMMTKPKLLKRPRRTATSVVRGRLMKSTSVDKVSIMNLQYSYWNYSSSGLSQHTR
jgi:hypothetical protein